MIGGETLELLAAVLATLIGVMELSTVAEVSANVGIENSLAGG